MRSEYRDTQYDTERDEPGRSGRPHHHHGGFGPGRRFRHGGFGAGPFGPEFGPGAGFGPGRRFGGRGPRARKGDIRAAILSLLAETPSNGYGLIRAIAERTDGAWRPSPGSVYPTLAQLVDEELIEPTENAGPRSDYRLTDAGRSYVEEHGEQIASAWAMATAGQDERGELWTAVRKLIGAIRQVAMDATPEQREQATTKVDDLRRELYRILGE